MRTLVIVHQSDSGPGVFDALIRELGSDHVDSWFPDENPTPPGAATDYDAILSFGGAVHPTQDDLHPWLAAEKALLRGALADHVPTLGICLGAQLIAEAAGTHTLQADEPEIGWYKVQLTPAAAGDPLFGELAQALADDDGIFEALEWHSYVIPLPPGGTALCANSNCLQAYRLGDSAWGVQSHPEVAPSDFKLWLADADTDPSFARLGLSVDVLGLQTEGKIAAWNQIGEGLAGRFLNFARERAGVRDRDRTEARDRDDARERAGERHAQATAN